MEKSNHLLGDIEEEIYLQPAPKPVRLLNYIIDIIAFYAISFIISIFFAAVILSNNAQALQEPGESDSGGGAIQIGLLLAFFLLFIAYYTVMEGLTKGRTIGKFITGTQAVKKDGSNITFKQAFIRSISRLVPFEPFSALGLVPWHDDWAGTIVIKKKK